MSKHIIRWLAVAFLGLAIAACGGDDAAEPEAGTVETTATAVASSEVPSEATSAPTEAADAEDLIDAYLRSFGLSGDVLTDEERSCMNAELATGYDSLPADVAQNEEFREAVDAAATACNANIGL